MIERHSDLTAALLSTGQHTGQQHLLNFPLHIFTTWKIISNFTVREDASRIAISKERLDKQVYPFTSAITIVGEPAMHLCRPLLMTGYA